jgi:hypothetical protein
VSDFVIPEEDRCLLIPGEDREIEVPVEIRLIEIEDKMLIGSRTHTAGDTKRWIVSYAHWLANTSKIDQIDVVADNDIFTIGNVEVLGDEIVFYISGGEANEKTKLLLTMTDKLGNIKNDTIIFNCVAP